MGAVGSLLHYQAHHLRGDTVSAVSADRLADIARRAHELHVLLAEARRECLAAKDWDLDDILTSPQNDAYSIAHALRRYAK
jgi:hypothetical protein